jgi:hypothetical protein
MRHWSPRPSPEVLILGMLTEDKDACTLTTRKGNIYSTVCAGSVEGSLFLLAKSGLNLWRNQIENFITL